MINFFKKQKPKKKDHLGFCLESPMKNNGEIKYKEVIVDLKEYDLKPFKCIEWETDNFIGLIKKGE